MPENWKPIPDFPGYEVSDHGRVRSYHKRASNGNGGGTPWIISDRPQLILASAQKTAGYRFVHLSRGGITTNFMVHQLVMLAFVGPCPDDREVCHGDGDPDNNHLDNLRYDTHAANMQEADNMGCPRMFGDTEVAVIRADYQANPRAHRELAAEYGCSVCVIGVVLAGSYFPDSPAPRIPCLTQRTLTDEQVHRMRADHLGGKGYSAIVREYNVDVGHLSRIINNKVRVDSTYTPGVGWATTDWDRIDRARMVDTRTEYATEEAKDG